MNRSIRFAPSSDHASRLVVVSVTVGLALMSWACSSTSQAQFTCDSRINDGLLLAIDLVEVTDEEVKQIQEAGDDWFTSPARDQLRNRIKTISVPGGCSETVELASLTSSEKFLRKKKGYGTLAVIAEYQTITGDSTKPRMVFKPRTAWKGKTTLFQVHEDYLSVQGVR